MLNVESIQELVNAVIEYKGKNIVVTSIDRLQVFDKVDVNINDIGFILESECEDNMIKFTFSKIEDVYIDEIDIFEDKDLKEIHIVFEYEGKRYSILNLI